MYSEDLINYLNQNLHVGKVYMNNDGGWLFYPHPSYKNETLRSEILDKKIQDTAQVIEQKKEVVKTKKIIKKN